MSFFKMSWRLYKKDMRIAFRQKSLLLSMVVFAILLQVLFSLAFDANLRAISTVSAGFIWLPVFLTAFIGVGRFNALEHDGGWEGLLSAPIDYGAIFLGKAMGNFTLVLLVGLVSVPLFFILFAHPLPLSPLLLGVTLLMGSWGYVTLASFFAVMTDASRLGEVLLPILLFPVSVPLVIAVVQLTQIALVPTLPGQMVLWLSVLGAYDILFTILPMLLFEFLLDF